jgi:hypothetical protein
MSLALRTGVIAGLVALASLAGWANAAADTSLPLDVGSLPRDVSLPTGQVVPAPQEYPVSVGGVSLDLPQALDQAQTVTPTKPRRQAPSWFTPRVQMRAHRAGSKGIALPDVVFKSCPGTGPTVPGVQAGTCEVAPYGCTANFIFYNGPTVTLPGGVVRPAGSTPFGASGPPFTSDGQHWFIGTAGHCLKGGAVYMQTRAPGVYVPDSDVGGIAEVGTTYKHWNAGIGRDFGAVQISKGFLVTPSLPIGGPQGIYDQCAPAPVHYFGHGYYFAVAQGKPEGGGAFWPAPDYYYWAGPLLPGDSGSGVLVGPLAAGDLTHGLGVGAAGAFVPLPVGFGTRMPQILDLLGRGFYLVNADGSLSRTTTSCSGVDPLGMTGLVKK